jgi:hypothetical protein
MIPLDKRFCILNIGILHDTIVSIPGELSVTMILMGPHPDSFTTPGARDEM